jgi:hypothetical protein
MTTQGALGLLCGVFFIMPAISFFIGYLVGRRRIRLRSPLYRGPTEQIDYTDPDSPVRVAGKSILGRLRQ